ncbi:MAG: IS607 family transposase, partial [Oscillospiraceae bacterium]|nr:IS607 family transposase [Oscillospiraceae bacterium]
MKKMSITEFAAHLGVIPDTVRRWERMGKIKPERTRGGHRRYTQKDIDDTLGIQTLPKEKRKVIYCRVSNESMQDELHRQIEAMEYYALGRDIEAETITEYGDGINMSRPEFVQLVTDIINGEIDTLIVAHKDRLARFGYELIECIANNYGCEIVVAGCDKLSPHTE